MRALTLVLLTLALAGADSLYTCLGYTFQLPLDFTSAQRSPQQGYVLYYPDSDPDALFMVIVDRLPAEQAASKAEFFNTAYKTHVSRNSWSITGKSRTILGRTVTEAGGVVTNGQNQGRALAYLIPASNGDQLFLAVVSLHQEGTNQLESIAGLLTSSLKLER